MSSRSAFSRLRSVFTATLLAVAVHGGTVSGSEQGREARAGALTPRPAFARPASLTPYAGQDPARIVVKFAEGSGIRFEGVRALSRAGRRTAELQSVVARIAADVRPVFERPEGALLAEKASGEARGKVELPDLTLFFQVRLDAGVEPQQAIAALLALDVVETAYFAPLPIATPSDIPPATPDFTANQTYQGAAPSGVDALYAFTLPGGRGAGVRVCDIEYAWHLTHEDFCGTGITLLGATPVVPSGLNVLQETFHGTASLAVVGADWNGYGVRGIASEAIFFVAAANTQAGGYNPANAINLAASTLAAGDVILVELQAAGPLYNPSTQFGAVPIEWNAAEYSAIATATANGRVVVEAAGNGSQQLNDTTTYGSAFDRRVQDSGAILVAAADSMGNPMSFTNYGSPFGASISRIDLHAWGTGVFTAGYGDAWPPNFNSSQQSHVDQAYTSGFGGTSSAAAIVAGSAASLQGISQQILGTTMPPLALRAALVSTGTPQAPVIQHIGEQPDLRAASVFVLQSAVVLPPYALRPITPGGFDLIQPFAIAVPDLDGDGMPDIVIGRTNQSSGAASVETFLNQGGGNFVSWSGPVSVGSGTPWIVAGDIDNDGIPDVAAAESNGVTVLLGDGAGGFRSVQTTPLPSPGFGIDAADVNGDGNLDLAVAQGGSITVLYGNGAGGVLPTVYPQAGSWVALRIVDVNADGAPDYCLTGGASTDVLLNAGNGAPAGGAFGLPIGGQSLAAGDLNQDTIPDLAAVDSSAGVLNVFIGSGMGQLANAPPIPLPSPMVSGEIALLDVDGDLLLDAVVTGVPANPSQGNGFAVLLGDGRGGFDLATMIVTGGLPGQVAAADFDGDSLPDVASTEFTGIAAHAHVHRNASVQRGMRCRAGAVNARGGIAADVLRVNFSSGDVDRIVRAAPSAPVTIAMAAPPAGPVPAPFALYAVRQRVGFSNETAQPFGLGTMCFPTPLSGGTLPGTVVVANSLGFQSRLGTPVLNVPPAPTTVVTVNRGFPSGTVIALQGFIRDRNARTRGASITNFVELLVR